MGIVPVRVWFDTPRILSHTSSPNWLDHETSECDWWPHVTSNAWPYDPGDKVCDAVGGYTSILLKDNSLLGMLPAELALLPYLQTMDVSGNPGLTGEVPESLCNATAQEEVPIMITCNASLACDCGCQCA